LFSYCKMASEYPNQASLWAPGQSWDLLWSKASSIYSFGRLSAFSYLEYVKIMGFGGECEDLMFEDFDGSRSHRNGALFLEGLDHMVYDKRAENGFDGKYNDFPKMCQWLAEEANHLLLEQNHRDAGYFTLESQYCQFKNGFFRRRYPGVYADMAWERIEKYDEQGERKLTLVFKNIREQNLPDWLRIETESKSLPRPKRAAFFADTGMPFRGEFFL